jgi:hypothetical protein
MKFKYANTHTIQCMGQDISLRMKGKTHDLNHDLTFSAHTIKCVCHIIRSMFRVHLVYITLVSIQIYNNFTKYLIFLIYRRLKVYKTVFSNLYGEYNNSHATLAPLFKHTYRINLHLWIKSGLAKCYINT